MSNVVRRKHVMKEMLEDDFELPTEQQQIVRVVCSRGNNLHEVETAIEDAERFLASMPVKFRKNVWVKRGDFVLVEPIEEGDKVKAEICKILTAEHVKEYTKAGVWPATFVKKHNQPSEDNNLPKSLAADEDEDDDSSMDEEFRVCNHNRPQQQRPESESDDEDDDDDETDSDEELDSTAAPPDKHVTNDSKK